MNEQRDTIFPTLARLNHYLENTLVKKMEIDTLIVDRVGILWIFFLPEAEFGSDSSLGNDDPKKAPGRANSSRRISRAPGRRPHGRPLRWEKRPDLSWSERNRPWPSDQRRRRHHTSVFVDSSALIDGDEASRHIGHSEDRSAPKALAGLSSWAKDGLAYWLASGGPITSKGLQHAPIVPAERNQWQREGGRPEKQKGSRAGKFFSKLGKDKKKQNPMKTRQDTVTSERPIVGAIRSSP